MCTPLELMAAKEDVELLCRAFLCRQTVGFAKMVMRQWWAQPTCER